LLSGRTPDLVSVYVKSRKIAIRSILIPNYAGSVIRHEKISKRVVEYEKEIDEVQKVMLEFADKLAETRNITIKVIDLSKLSFLRKIMRRALGEQDRPAIDFPATIFSFVLDEITKGGLFINSTVPSSSEEIRSISTHTSREIELPKTLQNRHCTRQIINVGFYQIQTK